jgi:hypothetical protein
VTPSGTPPWDPLGLWRQVAPVAQQVAGIAKPIAATAGGIGSLGAKTTLQVLVEVARTRLVGRQLRLGTKQRPLVLTITDVDVAVDPVLMAAGQTDRAALVAKDVAWGVARFSRARAELRNVHTRPGTHPVLVASPVDIEAVLPPAWLTDQLSRRTTRVALDLEEPASPRLRLAARPDLGWVELTAQAEGGVVILRPAGIAAGGRSWALGRVVPPVVIPLGLPEAVRVVGLEFVDEGLVVRLRADEWRLDYLEWLTFARKQEAPR